MRKVSTSLAELSELLSFVTSNKSELMDEYLTLSEYLNYKLEEQEKEERELSLITSKTPAPFLEGIKNGLNAYKYMMLTLSTCIFLSPIKIPSLPSNQRAMLGMSALGIGVIYSFSSSFLWQWSKTIESYCKQNNKTQEPQKLTDLPRQRNHNITPSTKQSSYAQNSNTFFAFPSEQQELISTTSHKLIYA